MVATLRLGCKMSARPFSPLPAHSTTDSLIALALNEIHTGPPLSAYIQREEAILYSGWDDSRRSPAPTPSSHATTGTGTLILPRPLHTDLSAEVILRSFDDLVYAYASHFSISETIGYDSEAFPTIVDSLQ